MAKKTKKLMTVIVLWVFSLSVFWAWFAATVNLDKLYSQSTQEDSSDKSNFDSRNLVAYLKQIWSDMVKDVQGELNTAFIDIKNDIIWANKTQTTKKKQTFSFGNFFNSSSNTEEDSVLAVNKTYFEDVENHEYEKFIYILANKEIVNFKNHKFHPNHHLRVNEVVKMVMNTYAYKTSSELDFDDNNWELANVPAYYNKAYDLWLLDDVWDNDKFDRVVYYNDVKKIFSNFESRFDLMIYAWALERFEWAITRWEFAKVIVNVFDLKEDPAEKETIQVSSGDNEKILANVWIIDDGMINLSDENLTRAEFITILSKAILAYEWENTNLNRLWVEIYFSDLDYNSDLVAYVDFAKKLGLVDYLEETIKMEKYFGPDKYVTQAEMTYILNMFTDSSLNSNSNKLVSKEDYFNTIVSVFEFDDEKKTMRAFLG